MQKFHIHNNESHIRASIKIIYRDKSQGNYPNAKNSVCRMSTTETIWKQRAAGVRLQWTSTTEWSDMLLSPAKPSWNRPRPEADCIRRLIQPAHRIQVPLAPTRRTVRSSKMALELKFRCFSYACSGFVMKNHNQLLAPLIKIWNHWSWHIIYKWDGDWGRDTLQSPSSLLLN